MEFTEEGVVSLKALEQKFLNSIIPKEILETSKLISLFRNSENLIFSEQEERVLISALKDYELEHPEEHDLISKIKQGLLKPLLQESNEPRL